MNSFSSRAVRALSVLVFLLPGLAASVAVRATTLNDWLYDLSTPRRFYTPGSGGGYYWYSATAVCAAEMPPPSGPNPTSTYSNPRADWRTNMGFGCAYHLTTIWNGYPPIEQEVFYQNWVYPVRVCPTGTTLNGNGLCQAARTPQPGTCPVCVGNPLLPGQQAKVQIEVDYRSRAAQGGLYFERQYSSWHFKGRPNTLGANWFLSVFGRYLTFDASPTFIAATRALANTSGWDLSGGVWVARTVTADRLENFSDGAGSAYRYYDSERNAYEFYDANGVLLRIQTLGGYSYTLTYSTASTPSAIAPFPGLLIGIASSDGAQLALVYDGAGRLSTLQDPAGQTYSYAYEDGSGEVPAGYLRSVTYPDNTTRQYQYEIANGPLHYFNPSSPPTEPLSVADLNALGQAANATAVPDDATHVEVYLPPQTDDAMQLYPLTGITDESGVRFATWQYDSKGRPTYSAHAGGAEAVSLSYTSAYSVVVTRATGNVNTYNLTALGSVSSISGTSCPDCGPYKSYAYNGDGTVSWAYDWKAIPTQYAYNPRGLETSRTEDYNASSPRTIATTWHATYRLPTLISVYAGNFASGTPKRTTAFTYDTSGNLLTKTITDPTVTPAVSRTWTYTYDSLGRVLSEDGPRTDVTDLTTYTYYTCSTGFECGQLYTVTNALNQVTTFNTYNAHGQPLTITDPNGVVTTLAYDARQRLVSRQVASETIAFEYWPTGLLKKVTLPDASYLLYTYDDAHRLVRVEDDTASRIEYTLDAMDNRTAESVYNPSNTLASTRTRVFNSLNQLWKELGAAGTAAVTTTFGYDNNSNQTTINAPLTRNTTNQYDELNRLKQITDPANGITQLAYDANNNLTSVTDPRSKVTSYQYTGFGEVKQLTSPDTGTTTSGYDSAGNLATRTDARSKTGTYGYDALNRVIQIAYPD